MLNDTLNYNTLLSKTTENSIHWMQKQLSGLGIKEKTENGPSISALFRTDRGLF